ncbi:Sec-independent protein translocase subunit TatA [Allokutzneria sp. A3M-2-11 16]|uniref:Sec-independent protein translocase subunit TatA n=1 Tax=Allokutzneria sp. A3M-2-11 16 TaxID=2962043 RepID=UPI0020B63D2B|nr:Sec-independent protein translocase subunit TatA [Allokutzneria sp. A3M-2-11 16]MCP3803719.1 Sec-independent protein translocase subunit TatA [Allokutzneria sp. A3M-2-11 16]
MPNLGGFEIIIIALVVVLLFGAAKLPTMARSIGQSMRIFKAETKAMNKDGQAEETAQPQQQAYQQQPAPLPPAQPVQQQPAPQVAPPLEQQQPRTDTR